MRFQALSIFLLMLTLAAGLPTSGGCLAAGETHMFRLSSAQEQTPAVASELTDLMPMATELEKRSAVLEKEIGALLELSAVENSLAGMAKGVENLSGYLKSLKSTERYGYDQLFEIKAQIDQQDTALQELIQSINEAISQAEVRKKEWLEEGTRWEKLQSSLSKQVPSRALEPTVAKVRHIISRLQNLISQALERSASALQAAEEIRASQSSLILELDALVSVLRDNLIRKTAPSMFSARYYFQFTSGLSNELPKSLNAVSWPQQQFFQRRGWLLFTQVFFFLVLTVGTLQQRNRLMEKEQWHFIARRPFAAGIFVAVATTSLFYGAVPGLWRLLYSSVIIISLARLVGAFVENVHRRWLIYGLSVYLITTRLFGVFSLPLSFFRIYIFSSALIGLFLCLWRSAASARRGDAHLYTWALRLGALLCLVILVAEIGGYSALSAHLLESSLKTILMVLAGWMLMVMVRGFLELAVCSPPIKKIPFLQVKTNIIVSRSSLLTDLLVATLTGTLVLVAWRVYASPTEAIQAVWSFGLTSGPRRITVGLILTAAALLYGAFFISWAVQAMLMEGLFTRRQLQVGVRISMARLVHYGFVFLGFLLALLTLGVQLRDLTIIAGALGVGIGFGLQGIVNNFVSGLILLFERPIKVGDYIQLGEQWAEIRKIGLRATVVQTFDRSEVVVPNSDLVSNQVTNWTLSDRYARIRIPVGVAYGSDVPLVMQALLECAQEHARVAKNPAPQVLFMGFGESSLDFELRVWISEVDNLFQIRSELNQEIDKRFRSAGIEIPFPQRDLHLRTVQESDLSVSDRLQDPLFNSPSHKEGVGDNQKTKN